MVPHSILCLEGSTPEDKLLFFYHGLNGLDGLDGQVLWRTALQAEASWCVI